MTGFCAGCSAYKLICTHGTPVRLCPLPPLPGDAWQRLLLGQTPVEDDAPAVRVGDRDAAAVPIRAGSTSG
jgi:hypothetical protein